MNILALGIGNLGGPDLFIILLIVLVLFGAKKLPDLARSLGQSMNEFRKAREEIDRELHNTGTESSRLQTCCLRGSSRWSRASGNRCRHPGKRTSGGEFGLRITVN